MLRSYQLYTRVWFLTKPISKNIYVYVLETSVIFKCIYAKSRQLHHTEMFCCKYSKLSLSDISKVQLVLIRNGTKI